MCVFGLILLYLAGTYFKIKFLKSVIVKLLFDGEHFRALVGLSKFSMCVPNGLTT